MTKEEAKAIFQSIQENSRRLSECSGPHDFSEIVASDHASLAFQKKRCTKCKGTLNALDVLWYERGLNHGRQEKSQ